MAPRGHGNKRDGMAFRVYRYTTTLYFVCNLAAYLKKRIRSLTCIIHTYYSNVTFGCMLWAVLNKGA